ncbi:integrase, partial [Vibrio anguillarum]|nr:integrase [Vibrio anguillarum]
AESGSFYGVYDFDKRTKVLLDGASRVISDTDAQKFKKKYPYISRDIAQDDIFLCLSERDKACTWLFEQGYYQNTDKTIRHSGISAVLNKLLFDGKMLYHEINAPVYPELHLKESIRKSEYRAVENNDTSSGTNSKSISVYIEAIRLINTNLEREDAASPSVLSERVSAGSISQLVDLKKLGRT